MHSSAARCPPRAFFTGRFAARMSAPRNSVAIARVEPIEAAQQAWPDQLARPLAQRRQPRLLAGGAQDVAVDLDQVARVDRAARLGAELHRARRLEEIHRAE